MTAAANVITRPLDWRVWAPGFVLPVACVLGDYALGEYVLWQAPAALLSLMAIGMGALALARRRAGAGFEYLTMGPLWVAAISALAIGGLLMLLAPMGLAIAAGALKKLEPIGLLFLVCALLATTPLWTGATYAMGAIAVTRQQRQKRGRLATMAQALLGAAATFGAIIALQAADSQWVGRTVDRLDEATPAAWETTFRSLRAYPLCGRTRCRWHVCRKLLKEYPADPTATLPFAAQVPEELDAVFAAAFGQSTQELCRDFD